jgi:hypothetical protein
VRRKTQHRANQHTKAAPVKGGARTRRQKDPSSSSLLEMRNTESFLIIRRVERDCQARGTIVRIIHYQVGLYHLPIGDPHEDQNRALSAVLVYAMDFLKDRRTHSRFLGLTFSINHFKYNIYIVLA